MSECSHFAVPKCTEQRGNVDTATLLHFIYPMISDVSLYLLQLLLSIFSSEYLANALRFEPTQSSGRATRTKLTDGLVRQSVW